jgi:hypothetical protein
MLLHTCPHTTIYVSSYYYIRPRSNLLDARSCECIRVRILLHTCPHTTPTCSTRAAASAARPQAPHTTTYVPSYYYIRVLIRLHTSLLLPARHAQLRVYTCPHTTTYVSSYYYIRVLIRLHTSSLLPARRAQLRVYTCPHTTTYVSSYYYIRVLIRLHTSSLLPARRAQLRVPRVRQLLRELL